MRLICLGLVLSFAAASPSFAQDWTAEALGQNEGRLYTQSGNSEAGSIRAVTLSEIEASCSCKLSESANGSELDRVEFGLSTMWIDAYDLSKTKHNSTAHFYGEGETERGTRKIMAGFYDTKGEAELRVYMAKPENFSLTRAKAALSAIQSSPASAAMPKPPKSKPAQKRQSGADLLAGVKRDIDKLNKAQPKKQKPPSAKPSSRATSGSDLLAGIRRDVEAPGKARAQKRAAERKAYIENAIKTAPYSGPYPMPVILKNEKSSAYVANWVDKGNGRIVAKDGDAKAPRMAFYNINYKLGQSEKTAIIRELKKAGLTSIKIPTPEVLEVTKKIMGGHSAIVTGDATRGGTAMRLFSGISYDAKTGGTLFYYYEAPIKQWKDWGGMAVPMARMGIYDQKDFTPAALAKLRDMRPAEEMKVYEEHYTGKMISLFQGIAMTRAATLNSMRSFNMSTATCAGMENCTVQSDGVGGYDAVVE